MLSVVSRVHNVGMATVDRSVVVEVEPLLVNGADAARLLGISARQFRRLDSAGLVPLAVRIGSSKRWGVDELRSWCSAGCLARSQWDARKNAGGPRRQLGAVA